MNNKEKLSTIFFAYQQFSSMIDLGQYNLNKTQHRIIYSISELNIASMGKLLKLLNISKQALNVSVRDLISQNLITEVRSEKDKRIRILKLTRKGTELNQKINQEQTAQIDALFKKVDNNWEQAMVELANEYINHINQ